MAQQPLQIGQIGDAPLDNGHGIRLYPRLGEQGVRVVEEVDGNDSRPARQVTQLLRSEEHTSELQSH